MWVSTLASLSALESDLLAQPYYWCGAGYRRTVFAVSPPTLVVRISPYQVPVSFGLGTSRDAASCDTSPDKHHRYVRPMSASQTLDYDYPYSLAPGAVHETYASRVVVGFGTDHVTGGGGAHAHPCLRFGVSHSPLVRGFVTVPGMLSADATHGTDL
jgi:hypothetical protein